MPVVSSPNGGEFRLLPSSQCMKLPNLTNSMINGLQEARSERVATLSQLLSITPGKTLSAQVEKVAPLNAEQREQLLNRTLETLLQLTQKPGTSAQRKEVARLLEQQQLLKSPLLNLIKLQVNNRPLITYTDKPARPGQTLAVTLNEGNRLVLTDSTRPTPNRFPTAASHPSPSKLLAEALRSVLPQRDGPALLDALPKIQALPLSHRQELFSPSVQQALKNLAQQLRSPTQLAHPKLLQTALKNNGAFFEHKLAQSLVAAREDGHSRQLDRAQSARLSSGDVKGALLQLVHRLNTDLGTQAAQPKSGPPQQPLAFGAATDLSQLLGDLARRSPAELNDRALRTQLLTLLHQQTLTSLARVQFQQLHSVSHQQGQAEAPQATQSWTLEIPVRQGQENHLLQLHIEQDWLQQDEENDEDEPRETRKVRQWQLLLSFPLPQAGNFHAQLTVVDESVSAKLWAEQADTLREVQQKMGDLKQQLEDKGIAVTRMECAQGKPANPTRTLRYSLVDVTT